MAQMASPFSGGHNHNVDYLHFRQTMLAHWQDMSVWKVLHIPSASAHSFEVPSFAQICCSLQRQTK